MKDSSLRTKNNHQKILIVEDSPTQAEKLKYLLEENNFQVTVARDGNEALNFLQIQLPDMIISDIMMPGMDGYTLCSKVKSDEKLRDIPVMLLTSLSDPEDVVKGLSAGADNFVTKPYSDKALLAQVDYILINKKLRSSHQSDLGIEIYFGGKKHKINSNRLQIIDLLLSTYESAVQKRQEAEETLEELKITQEELRTTNEHLEEMVLERTLRIEQLYELLKVIRDVNQLIVKTRDRDELIRRSCEIFTENPNFSCAFIILIDDNGKVTDVAESGYGKSFEPVQNNLNKNILPQCARQALETKNLVIVKEPHKTCPECPFSVDSANNLDFSIAIRSDDKTFGILNVCSNIDSPDEEGTSLLEEVAGDLGFALQTMTLEKLRKQMEEALCESEEKFRLLSETSPFSVFAYREKFIYANPAFEMLTGYSATELEDMNFWDLVHPDFRDLVRQRGAARLRGEKAPDRYEIKLVRQNGNECWIDAASTLMQLDGQPTGIGTAVDITERKQVEEALRTSEAQLSNAMVIAKLGYWEYDADEDLFTFNDHFYDIFRTTAEKVGGYKMSPAQYAERFLHPDDRALVTIEMQKAFETTDPNFSQTLEHRIIYADGEVGYISVRYFIVKDKQGRTVKTYGANQDITDKKRMETEKLELENQFRESQKMESIGTLAGGIAHDFNNLLTVIQGHAQMAMMSMDENDSQYKDLTQILNSSTRAASLTRQLLLFSRKQEVELKTLSLNQTIQNLLKMIKRLIGEDIVVDVKLASNLSNVEADEGNIEQVIMNLAVNARDAMPDGGKLTIKTENVSISGDDKITIPDAQPGHFVRISVEDTGCGILPEILPKIFEPFFSTKEKGKGTGLGLSVIYGIIKKHGGWVNVYSEPGHGTIFKIYLPASVFVSREKDSAKSESDVSFYGNGEYILIIEDEKGILDFATSVLRQFGYNAKGATSGNQAIALFNQAEDEFRLIISDVILPDINGYDLVKKLTKNHPDIPVLMSSGYTEEKVKQSIIQEKGFHFLQKPYSVSSLLEAVKKAIVESE